MENQTRMQRLSAFLTGAALIVFFLIFASLAVSSHFVTAHESIYDYPMEDLIIYRQDQPFLSLLGTVGVIAVLMTVTALIKRGTRFHIEKLAYALWAIGAVAFLWAIQLQPRADFKVVVDAALDFAKGDFSPLSDTPYFSDSPYQLGICLIMEILRRLCPWMDLSLLMQTINVLLSVLAVYAMGCLTKMLTENSEDRQTVYVLYLLFLPMTLYCIYVYGTIPMIASIAWAMLYFVRFLRNGKCADGWRFSILIALAVLFKPNAMVAAAALGIIALLHVLNTKDIRSIPYVFAGIVLAIYLPKCAVWIYELRSGIKLGESISMLSRLVMGFQESSVAPGWYNGYIALYSPSIMPPEEAKAILLTDLYDQFRGFLADPRAFWQFMKEKCMSQWLEPTHSTFWNASLSDINGWYNGLAYQVFREESTLSLILEKIMDFYQQAIYVLVCVGVLRTAKKRSDAAQALLPTLVLGGFLYHQLFEAKSQYTYVYTFFLMPLAAQGLSALASCIKRHRRCAK